MRVRIRFWVEVKVKVKVRVRMKARVRMRFRFYFEVKIRTRSNDRVMVGVRVREVGGWMPVVMWIICIWFVGRNINNSKDPVRHIGKVKKVNHATCQCMHPDHNCAR